MSEAPSHPIVAGFRWGGVACGLKKDEGALDLGLLVADAPTAAAAVFTDNRVKAAPVILAAQRMEAGRAQAVLVNAGNANACNGKRGLDDARATTHALALAMRMDERLILPCSTGIIGRPLPTGRMVEAMPRLVASLSREASGIDAFSRAIMTTDKSPKIASTQFSIGRETPVTILGVAKGAGMIHPQMATTLAFIVTDAPMHSTFLARALRNGVERTFSTISVDGDTSTNDTVIAMASGTLPVEPISSNDRDGRNFSEAIERVLMELGKQIVGDGEGAEHVVTIEVQEAPSESAARIVAKTIATSLLVKTALNGCDPNWGRIVAAAGRAGVAFDEAKVELAYEDAIVVKNGVGLGEGAEAQAREIMQRPEYTIRMKLGAGSSSATYLTCDIGHRYVDINASYSRT